MSKKKSKPCSFYSGIEPWKTKKRQKRDIDKKKKAEAFERMIRFLGN